MAITNNYDGRALRDGLRVREELKETPDTFGTRNKVGTQSNDKNLSRGSRMAFDRARAELLKQNPEEDQAALEWMKAFSFSPESEKWNNAKLNGQNPYLNSGEGGDAGPETAEELGVEEGAEGGVEETGGMA